MGSSVSGSRGARLQPVWRKGMTMTIGAVSTIILVVCKKLTPLVTMVTATTEELYGRVYLHSETTTHTAQNGEKCLTTVTGAAYAFPPDVSILARRPRLACSSRGERGMTKAELVDQV